MFSVSRQLMHSVPMILVTAVTAGCGGSAEAQFAEACLQQGQNAASQMMDREMHARREEFCKCGAKAARSSLSGKAFHAMVLGMQGRKQEAAEITMKMNESEQRQLLMGMGQVFQSCVQGGM
jgi:hypothetical protein